MSLADELLADLEDLDGNDVEVGEFANADEVDGDGVNGDMEMGAMVDAMEVDEAEEGASVRSIAKLLDSPELRMLRAKIDELSKIECVEPSSAAEEDPEYRVIIQCNKIVVDIDNEIMVIHKYIRDHYASRFPELEQLVPNPVDFVRIVRLVGNDLDFTKLDLSDVLPPHIIMSVTVTASTTKGESLTAEELTNVVEACDMAMELEECKASITNFVESRMRFIAPNLSALLGASTSAKLMGIAGGLNALAKMPSCNVQLLGMTKKVLSGFSSTQTLPHTGYVYYSPIVQATAPSLRRRAQRLVGGKCTLMARVDSCCEAIDGHIGELLRIECEKKIAKWGEPPPGKMQKPLPAPTFEQKKRRGGKRKRAMQARTAMSDLQKMSKRVQFGQVMDDELQSDMGFSLGALRQEDSGKIRATAATSANKVRMSKKMQARLARQVGGTQTGIGGIGGTSTGITTSGTASIAFTPIQGLEINTPTAASRIDKGSGKYFGSKAFTNLNKTGVTPKPK